MSNPLKLCRIVEAAKDPKAVDLPLISVKILADWVHLLEKMETEAFLDSCKSPQDFQQLYACNWSTSGDVKLEGSDD